MSADDHEMRRECAELFLLLKADTQSIAKDVADLKDSATALATAAEDRHAQVMRAFNGPLGNGARPGFNVRMDRLEQDSARRKWWVRGTITGVIALAAKAVYHWITTTKP